MSSPESAEQILQSVESELHDSADEQRASDLQSEELNLEARQESEEYRNTERSEESDGPHNSSAAVLEVSQSGSDLTTTMQAEQIVDEPRSTSAEPAAAIVATSSAEQSQGAPRARAATMPGAIAPAAQQQRADDLSAESNGMQVVGMDALNQGPTMTEKLLHFKSWGIKQLKCTKQYMAEQWGSGTRTTDAKLSDRLEVLMAQRDKYKALLRVSLRLCAQVRDVKSTQRELATVLGAFTVRSDELGHEVEANARTQRQLARNGDVLYEALSVFCASLTHLLNTAMEDTFAQLKVYQEARIEFDAYRTDEEKARAAASHGGEAQRARHERKVAELAEKRARFEALRKDLTVRVHFLEQNQLKVMRRQLTLLHNATCSYFTGDAENLEKCIRQFHIKMPQHLGQDATAAGPAAAAAAKDDEESRSLTPLPFPTPSELGTPSEALTALLSQQLTVEERMNGDEVEDSA